MNKTNIITTAVFAFAIGFIFSESRTDKSWNYQTLVPKGEKIAVVMRSSDRLIADEEGLISEEMIFILRWDTGFTVIREGEVTNPDWLGQLYEHAILMKTLVL